jgi:hypothetical protein
VRLAVFVDCDRTITDLDALDELIEHAAGAEEWQKLLGAKLSIRDFLAKGV